jgi:hypothetical protein
MRRLFLCVILRFHCHCTPSLPAFIPHVQPDKHGRSSAFLRFDLKASVVGLQSLLDAEEPEAVLGGRGALQTRTSDESKELPLLSTPF